MVEDRPGDQEQDPTDPYRRPGARGSGQEPGRPEQGAAGAEGPQPHRPARQEQQWTSATQRREHPGAGGPDRAGSWSQQGGAPPAGLPRRAGAGSAFLIAVIATAIGLGITLLTGYAAVHSHSTSVYTRANLASAGLATWPSGSGVVSAGVHDFILTLAVAGVVMFLLLWAAIASTPGGRGALTVLLAGWGATLVAGAVAAAVAVLTVGHDEHVVRVLGTALNDGADWAVRVGWVVGVVAALGHLLRRRREY